MVQAVNNGSYLRPTSLEEALGHISGNCPLLLAGGTDVYPSLQGRSLEGPILDLTSIASLRTIKKNSDHWFIGALATWSDVRRADLPPAFCALQQAAREVGSTQIQNRGTLVGNICNASPAADGVPPLLILNAEVLLASSRGQRRLALDQFILGSRKTALAPDELVTGVCVPLKAVEGVSTFVKLGARRYLVISIAMIATRIAVDRFGRVSHCAIAVGACSAVAKRFRKLEHSLIGLAIADIASERLSIEPNLIDSLEPIDDVRGTAGYRREAVAELIVRCLQQTAKEFVP
jgi:CO/xanthine dehydrogenase FAD-binding subunit